MTTRGGSPLLPVVLDDGRGRRSWLSSGGALAIALILAQILPWAWPPAAKACDDGVLLLVTGSRPNDRVSRQLLEMCHRMRDLAGDLDALNDQAARRKLDAVLKLWIPLDTGLLQNPPKTVQVDPDGLGKVKRIATLLGEIRRMIEGQDLLKAHDLLEPTVTQMSALSSLVLGHAVLQEFLAAEYLLMTLKPGYLGRDLAASASDLASFTAQVSGWPARVPEESRSLVEGVLTSAAALQAVLGASPAAHPAKLAIEYNALLQRFSALKKDLLARGWFTTPD